MSRNAKTVSYRTVLNACLSFLNEVKNLAEVGDIKCTHCRILTALVGRVWRLIVF